MASHEQHFRAGEAKGQAEEKTGRMMEKGREAGEAAKEKAGEAKDKTAQTVGYGKDKTAEAGKDKNAGIMHRTGDQVKSVTHGAADAVKHTFGMGTEEHDAARRSRD